MNNERKQIHLICSIDIIFVGVIVFLSLLFINKLKAPIILNDEFGYWSNAASFIGLDWSALISETPYYSLGYSILLIPLLLIFQNTALMYQMAIVLNALLLIGQYFLAKKTLINLFRDDNIRTSICALISTVNSYSLFHVKIAWTEIWLMFLMWFAIWLLTEIKDNKGVFRKSIFVFLLFLMYFSHQRMIGACMMGLLCIIYFSLKEKEVRSLLIIIVEAIFLFLVYKWVHEYQLSQMAINSNIANMNTISAVYVGRSLQVIFTKFGSLVKSGICKFAISILSTYYLLFIPFIFLVLQIRQNNEINIPILFAIGTFLLSFGLSSVQMMGLDRKDMIVYTRYMEFSFPPIIAIGGYLALSNFEKYKKAYSLAFFIVLICTSMIFREIVLSKSYFNVPCSALMGALVRFIQLIYGHENYERVKALFKILCIIEYFLLSMFFGLKSKNIKIVGTLIFTLTISVIISHYSNNWLFDLRDRRCVSDREMASVISTSSAPIFFVKEIDNNDYCNQPKYLQFLLKDRTINVIETIDDIKNDEYWILTNSSNYLDEDICPIYLKGTYMNLYKVNMG